MDTDVSVNFIVEGTKPNKDNQYPIKLNLYQKDAGQKRYGIKENIRKDDWVRLNNPKLRDKDLQALKARMSALEGIVKKIIAKLNPFSFVAFEEAYLIKSTPGENSNKIKSWFDKYIKSLEANGQIGTASSYQTTFNSLNGYKKNLSLHDITPAFLLAYENYMTKAGKSISTVGIYLRQLRAIDANVISAERYPFKKYQIPAGRNTKKALSDADLNKLLNYKANTPDKQKAIDFWLLSYLCNGMNFADIIELKPNDIDGNYLHFMRVKTKRTKKKDLRPIRVGLNPRAIEIIELYKNTVPTNPFLFPVLEKNLTPLTTKHRCQGFIKWVNKRMALIAEELAITQKIGTYAARHSFSTVLKRKGVSTEYIKEALGHSSMVTTENYLDSFTDDVKLLNANLLTQL